MSHDSTPHFHNQPGVAKIKVGSKEFMCIGALPPFDHPHVFIDMGAADEAVCPYCSTHYVFDAAPRPWRGRSGRMRLSFRDRPRPDRLTPRGWAPPSSSSAPA